MLFGPDPADEVTDQGKRRSKVVTVLPELTDNRGNTFVLNKLMTTKFPLCCVLMELAARMRATSTILDLSWAPRLVNQEADALTNGDTRGFDPGRRMEPDMAKVRFLVLPEFMEAGVDKERNIAKERRRAASKEKGPPRRKGKRVRLRDSDPW